MWVGPNKDRSGKGCRRGYHHCKRQRQERKDPYLALDTEEFQPGGDKRMTPWGKKAKEEAQRIFVVGKAVTLEFPGKEAADICWESYRDNYGRAMAYVYAADGSDFQKHMISQGYSPYFVKYGYAEFPANHKAYQCRSCSPEGE